MGHYCRICGRTRANEKFSGKGHAKHICKDCAGKSGRRKGKHLKSEGEFPLDRDFMLQDDLSADEMEEDLSWLFGEEPQQMEWEMDTECFEEKEEADFDDWEIPF